MQYKLGFLGTGVMAGAIINRLLLSLDNFQGLSPKDIAVFDIDQDKVKFYENKGLATLSSVSELFEKTENIVIAVKPQFFLSAIEGVTENNAKNLISIMAGISTDKIILSLPEPKVKQGIVRVMPNTPAKIGKGVSAVYFRDTDEKSKEFITEVFHSVGQVVEINENQFDAVTSVSGSGPAYVFMFADAIVQGGIEGGLSEEVAKLLALNMIEGAAALAKTDFDSPLSTLTQNVCSKGGTTIEAVKVFEREGLVDIVKKGVRACRLRSEELSK